MALTDWLFSPDNGLAGKEFGMSSKRVHRSALVAAALVVAGCPRPDIEGQYDSPGAADSEQAISPGGR